MSITGYDISHHNQLHPRQVAMMATEEFVIMKATEGKTWIDPTFGERATACSYKVPGICYGFYHYGRPDNGNSAYAEALHFVKQISKYVGSAVLALDIEQKALELPDPQLEDWVLTWLTAVYTMTGVKPLLYIQKSELKRFPRVAAADFGLWLAYWKDKAPKSVKPWPFWAVWQHNADAIDKDIFNGSREQFMKYAEVKPL